MTTAPPACPRCRVPVQPDWDWCHSCGFDPDGLRAPDDAAAVRLPGSAAPPPRPPAPPDLLAPPPRRELPPSDEGHPVGTLVKVLAVVVVAVVAVGAVGYLVMRNSDEKSTPTATPAFSAGLTAFFSTTRAGASPVVLPEDLPGCVQQKLTVGEVADISGLQRPADADRLADQTGIDVYRAVRDCDLAGAAEVLTAQEDFFSKLGVADLAQQQCVMEHFISGIAALPDSTTGSMDIPTRRALESSFKGCVPFAEAFASTLHVSNGIPTDAATCIADRLGDVITWSDLFNDGSPPIKAKIEAAIRQAVPACR